MPRLYFKPRAPRPYAAGVIGVSLVFLCPAIFAADRCGSARQVGTLDHRVIPEASGIAASAAFPDRLYFINDGGSGPYFFVTNSKGEVEQSVRIAGGENSAADYEGLSLGPCSHGKSCLFVGDVGDNHAKRAWVEILIFEEVEKFASPVTPWRRVTLTYPDGAHDVEGLGVGPNGDVYLLTKGMDYEARRAWPSKLFRLRRHQWERAEGPQTATLVGELDLGRIAPPGSGLRSRAATGFDVAPDGSRFLVLTYADAFELLVDLSSSKLDLEQALARGRFRTIPLTPLLQQECVTYLADGKSILYATESKARPAEIMRVDCMEARTGS